MPATKNGAIRNQMFGDPKITPRTPQPQTFPVAT